MNDVVSNVSYISYAQKLQALPTVALMPTGRTGSDYLQGLLENHPEILTFNGHFLVYEEFLELARSTLDCNFSSNDVADEFIGLFLYKLVSKYDIQEGKDRLGEERNESFAIDTAQFKKHFVGLMEFLTCDRRGIVLAIYGAYNMALNRSVDTTKVMLHHPHLEDELRKFVSDFPATKVLYTIRDIRASFYSQIANFKKYYPDEHDCQSHYTEALKMNLNGSRMVQDLQKPTMSIRLEDLPRSDALTQLSGWLGIEYDDSMLLPTWAGLGWNGDRLSTKVPSNTWSKDRTSNNWQKELSRRDQWFLKCLVGRRLVSCGYTEKRPGKFQLLLAVVNAVIPMTLEWHYLSPKYISSRVTKNRTGLLQVLETPLFYTRRVKICLWSLKNEFLNKDSSFPLIRVP